MGSLKDRAFGGELYRLQGYPHSPGHVAGSTTSERAARRIAGHAKAISERILELLRDRPGGLTTDEVAAALHMQQPYAARPRLAELHRRGQIIDSGQRRPGQSGVAQAVWKSALPLPNEGKGCP